MLSHHTTTTRPRPPAKARRSTSSLKASGTPPPAYASSFPLPAERQHLDALLGSPMTATFQMVGWETSPIKEDTDWMNEKSREELAELLVKADDLIKERENELGVTSAVCKNLYESNVTLQTKHQALLARLPTASSSQAASLEFNPPALPGSPSREYVTLDMSTPDSVFGPYRYSRPSTSRRHARKISMSTNDISLLADQNAELLQKLEKLESEATSSDHAGRRELKRLENEISILREELEKTQAKSEELEQIAKGSFGWGSEKVVEDVWRKKKSREAKFKKMRDLGRDFNGESSRENQNFAPEGSLFGGPSAGFSFFSSPSDIFEEQDKTATGFFSSSLHPEHAIISQLLGKIQELEAANARIVDKQMETSNQLQAVQRETENMAKVYECLVDPSEVQLELEEMTQDWKSTQSTNETIRFRSLRRKLDSEMSAGTSTQKSNHQRDFSGSFRVRKSIIGLFDEGGIEGGPSNQSNATKSLDLPYPFPVEIPSTSWNETKHGPSFSVGLASPALSTLGIFSPVLSPANGTQQTLESELGNEFTDSWGINAGNHHLRTTSLCDFSQFSTPSSPSPMHPPQNETLGSCSGISEHESVPTPIAVNSDLHLSVELPAPDAQENARGSAPKSPRVERMTQTIRSRTSRWADGRFTDTLTGGVKGPSEDVNSASTLHGMIPDRLADAIDNMVENFTGLAASDKHIEQPHGSSPTESPKHGQALQLRIDNSISKREKHGIGAMLLELWLWLQFIIVIVVFLWAMAKRGPKSVLVDAGQRKAVVRRG